jgi:hypothetical protein
MRDQPHPNTRRPLMTIGRSSQRASAGFGDEIFTGKLLLSSRPTAAR